ncbi:MAG: bifunctional metallophosphatase/5'-nucleotidase [Prevotella sp.]|nr:bifunctional metallophosphatase/5'-nucleotidase [Prevotella sp.]
MKLVFAALLLALTINSPAMAQQRTVKLRVIETSDVHGSFFPYDFINRKPKAGTLARVSSYVNDLRKTYKDNVILLENGDILQGQPTCYYYNYVNTQARNVASDVVNYMKYDAQAFGNHDVETGHPVYDKWIKELNCPVLGANIIDTKTGEPYVKPYIILNREGVKVAVLGLLTPAIPNWLTENLWSGLHFENMVTSARKWMKHILENEKPDVVIGVFHSGKDGGIVTPEYEEDASLRVAKDVPGFDLVLFGHDHTRCNETVTNVEGKPVICLDPANNALSVADAEITLTLNKKKVNGKKQYVVTDKKVVGNLADVTKCPIDEEFMKAFEPQIAEINQYVGKQIGTFKNTIHSRESFFGSCAFNDFILNLQLEMTKADISFNAPLQFNSAINAGPVYVSDMFNLYKYENQLYVMRLTGEEIRKHLEMSYDLWVNTMKSPDDHLLLLDTQTKGDQQRLGFKNLSFNFDSAAGIDYEVDVTKPDGEKVKILRMSNGQPFDERKWYNVAVNSYRGNGGGELLTRGAGIPKDSLDSRIIYRSKRDQRYYLMEAIEKMGTIEAKANNNWKFVPEAWTKPAAQRDYELLFGKEK